MKRKLLGAVMFFITAIAYSQTDTTSLYNRVNGDTQSRMIPISNKSNPDTLTFDELIIYKNQAVKLRKTGMVLTLGGIGLTSAGIIVGSVIMEKPDPDPNHSWMHQFGKGLGVMLVTGLFGVPSTLIGIPSWVVGARRKAKAEFSLQKFYIPQGNSMAFGAGIRIVF